MKKGKLIVIEGGDGSGKTTQAELLLSYLKKNKIPNASISFPRYDKYWGKKIRRFLDGEFGKSSEVDPYFSSKLYASDRAQAASQLKKWINQGKIIVCNRYIGSNIGHMAAKFKSQSEKSKYISWLENLEYKENGIPKEDVAVLLSVDPKVSRRLMKDRKLDIHEKDLKYQEEVFKVYDSQVKLKKNWVRVDCTRGMNISSPEEIHQKVLAVLKRHNILRTPHRSF